LGNTPSSILPKHPAPALLLQLLLPLRLHLLLLLRLVCVAALHICCCSRSLLPLLLSQVLHHL
jgi:hypothetical protein